MGCLRYAARELLREQQARDIQPALGRDNAAARGLETVTAASFERLALDPEKDVLLMLHERGCAACAHMAVYVELSTPGFSESENLPQVREPRPHVGGRERRQDRAARQRDDVDARRGRERRGVLPAQPQRRRRAALARRERGGRRGARRRRVRPRRCPRPPGGASAGGGRTTPSPAGRTPGRGPGAANPAPSGGRVARRRPSDARRRSWAPRRQRPWRRVLGARTPSGRTA